MSEGVVSTLVGAFTGLGIAIISSFFIPVLLKKQEKSEQKRSIYEKYAQPLAADAVNLLWRLDEILFKKRAQYLREEAPHTPFNEYKLISTCYRIAAVLGWIRAIKLEQSYLFYGDQASVDQLRCAVVDLEAALADSPQTEVHVLRSLAQLWRIALPEEPGTVERIAAQGNAEVQHFLSEYKLARYQELAGIDEAGQLEVARRIAATITQSLGNPRVVDAVLAETRQRALTFIALKQAWIYRDWQQAIGDLMINEIEDAPRRFDIIGYGKFEELFRDPGKPEHIWLARLRAVLIGVDVVRPDPGDFRLDQLREVARAIASLVCAIEGLQLERKILDQKACALARKFLDAFPPRPAQP